MSRETTKQRLREIISDLNNTSPECLSACDTLRIMDLEDQLTASRADAERLAECLRNVRPATLNCGTIDRQFWTGPSETTEIIDAALAAHEKDSK